MAGILQHDWYEAPEYYDIVFDANTVTEADFLDAVCRRYVLSGGRQVLEPACGTGRLIAELAIRGFRICGFDTNRAMLAFARARLRRQGLDAVLKQMDFSDFSFGCRRFDLAYCLVSSFAHISTESKALKHLKLMADVIRPGGIYVIGLHLTDYCNRSSFLERWEEKRNGMRVVCNIKTWPADTTSRTARMRARLTVHESRKLHGFECEWLARTYGPRQLTSLICREPRFRILCCHTFDFDIDTPHPLGGNRLDKVVVLRRMQ